MKKIYIYLYILLQLFHFSYSAGRLIFLYTHFRHGARGPNQLNNNNIDRLGEKWEGLGEITGVGERMQYLLGLRNRKKYIEQEKFLPEKFDPHQMLIFTSSLNRTIVSCYSQLQGLYPQRVNLGKTLTKEQEEIAYPPILNELKEKDADIEQVIKELGDSALPHRMMIAPIKIMNENEIIMGLHDYGECAEKIKKIKDKNEQTKEFGEITDKFNEKYAEKWNKFFKKEKNKFKVKEIKKICSEFLCDYTDKRKMKEFKDKTGLNIDILKEDCLNYYKMYYIYVNHGDEEKILAHVDSSKIMRQLLYYMKRRLDVDIKEVNEDLNFKDYSRPRYIMISGHDITVSADIVLLIKAFGLDMTTTFKFPKYASQFVLEVRTNLNKCNSYSDYYIVGYFDNTELFNINAEEFINKVEKEIWTAQQVDEYCGIQSNNKDNKSNKTITAKIFMSILVCFGFIFIMKYFS